MATRYDLEIVRGSTYTVRIAAKDDDGVAIDLTDYTVSGQARANYSSSDILLNLNPSIVSGEETNGYIDINISAATTAALPIDQAVYDIEIYSSTNSEKIMSGYLDISPEVTR
tara:strand:- start:126 stop:464 length:339 start_codon:yes stop_codon:yes gene_type:complete